ncbi:hypothetical protein B9K06_27055, partial [Bacillus sp. OG2]
IHGHNIQIFSLIVRFLYLILLHLQRYYHILKHFQIIHYVLIFNWLNWWDMKLISLNNGYLQDLQII